MHTQDFERAKRVLESLIHGNDPVTASELPPDAVVNRIEVNRALIIALAAVKETAARIARRAQRPSGVGKTWSPEEERSLSEEFKRKEAIEDIAKKHQRTVRAIETRLEQMRLLAPEHRTTQRALSSSVAAKKGTKRK